jgi:hypothetical protein
MLREKANSGGEQMIESWIRVLLLSLVSFLLVRAPLVLPANAAEMSTQGQPRSRDFTIDFSGYTGGSVDQWLGAKGFKFEKDARDRRLLQLSVAKDGLILEAKGRLRGFLLNDSVNLEKVTTIRIAWGIIQYPQEVSYARKVNNEALMLYVFFGKERIPSGHVLIPNSPYFIGLFLCDDDQVNFPYKGRYFHTGGRFVCLGKPEPNQTIVSEFDLDAAFKSYFGKHSTPGVTGIGLGVDTSSAGRNGTAAAFIKSIEFVEGDGAGPTASDH